LSLISFKINLKFKNLNVLLNLYKYSFVFKRLKLVKKEYKKVLKKKQLDISFFNLYNNSYYINKIISTYKPLFNLKKLKKFKIIFFLNLKYLNMLIFQNCFRFVNKKLQKLKQTFNYLFLSCKNLINFKRSNKNTYTLISKYYNIYCVSINNKNNILLNLRQNVGLKFLLLKYLSKNLLKYKKKKLNLL
jgi:hypothetical protein